MDWREFLCISVELTDFCNGRCIFCDHHYGNFIHGRKASFMKIDLFKKIIFELDNSEVLPAVISLSWLGESLLHPQINEIIDIINSTKRLNNFHINTNGMFLNKELIDKILQNEKIKRLRISIDANCSKTYNRIKSVSKFDFDKLINNIRYIMEMRSEKKYPQLVLSFVVCEENEGEALSFMEFWISEISKYKRYYLVTHDFYIPAETSGCDVIDYYMLLAPEQDKATELYRNVMERLGIYKYKNHNDSNVNQANMVEDRFMKEVKSDNSRRPCASLWRMANIHASGLLTICCHDLYLKETVGDLNNNSFKELWYGPEIEKIRKNHLLGNFTGLCSKCGNIEYFSVSDYMLEDYINKTGDKVLKEKYFKRLGIKNSKDFELGHN